MTDKLKGDTRPRPSNFKISQKDAEKIMEGKRKNSDKNKNNTEVVEYIDLVNLYLTEFKNYLKNLINLDNKNKYTLKDDVNLFKTKFKGDFIKFYNETTKKSLLLKSLYECSCKMTAIIFNIFNAKGPVIIYSNYVKMEGLDILKIYLNIFGYIDYNKDYKKNYNFVEFHGSISTEIRENNRTNFNDIKNIRGELIKIILISPAGSQGISLFNVREVHILEPYWNEVRINQLIGRAIRQCGHKDLPMKDRHVDIYRYKAIKKNKVLTTDQKIENLAKEKFKLINSFLTAIKEVAIDCELYKNVNMLEDKYQCFKFDEPKLFNRQNIGPAYKKNLNIDINLDNGLNSNNSIVKKVKVKKIYAIKKISENNYSDKQLYWLNQETNIVYDYELKFAIGKLEFNNYDIPDKVDKNTYIIGEIIDIPQLSNYE